MQARHGSPTPWGLPGLLAAAALLAFMGCSADRQAATTDAKADSIAYAEVRGIEDDAQRFTAVRTFLKEHPGAKEAGHAYVEAVELALDRDPASVESLLQEFSRRDFEDASVHNAIGWMLAEKGEHLDFAVPILEKGVAKARASGDQDALASTLDSEAWARYKDGDHARAVERMEEAYKIVGPGNDEIDEHMALIYDAAGQGAKARPIYVSLLGHMEHPQMRANLMRIVAASGESVADVEAEIQSLRAANMKDVPDFRGPSLADGMPISIADMRGKVVLLNFWHPT